MGRPSGLSCIGADSSSAQAYTGEHKIPKPHPDYGFDVLSEAFQGPDALFQLTDRVVAQDGTVLKDRNGLPSKGPSTYLHAVAGKGWPYDHKAEDTFEVPPLPADVQAKAGPPAALLSDAYWEAHYENEKKPKVSQEAPTLPKRHEWSEDRIYNISPTLNVTDHPELLISPGYAHTDNTPDSPQYSAAYTGSGKVILVLSTPDKTIGYFDTFADAHLAAEALNNHSGY